MKQTLDGRTALISGSARGIGLAISLAMARQGANVVCIDVDAQALEQSTSQYPDPDSILTLTADITRTEDVFSAVDGAIQRFGNLDILVNNAGICPLTPFDAISEREWDQVLAVNLKGAFLLAQASLPYLRDSGSRGRIINISSVAGQMGGVLVGAHYAASKAGLIGLTKSLAKLLAADGVTVNCVAPGAAETALTANWPDDLRADLQSHIPLARFGQADEIAAAACFLASAKASFITGATLDINGGLFMR
ncbi:MAG: SDR family oxidoreductase [Chloroflexi bacterium]|nr:SDR family oxidoreductase [Chloroflexota bacterium]